MIEYRIEHDLTPMVDEIAAKIQHRVDQAALDKAADTLERFGYVKVVRCRDCKYSSISFEETRTTCRFWALNDYDESNSSHGYTLYPCVKPDGFCAWAVKRTGAKNG